MITTKKTMRKYLSFGGGVNSVAMMLMLLDQGEEFEAVFVNHGTDWPETYEYFDMFQAWLKDHNHKQITVLRPAVKTIDGKIFDNLLEYYLYKHIFPFRQNRACTDRFKIVPLEKYQQAPCFVLLGIGSEESHRATIANKKGFEYRYPLIEEEIDREECKRIIRRKGLPVPPKSGCFICPFQGPAQYKKLRRSHPDLFCRAEKMEEQYIERRKSENKPPLYLLKNRALKWIVEESQMQIFEEDEYPPCMCRY